MTSYIIERNGLGIKRHSWGKSGAYWSIEHVACGIPLSGKIGYDHTGRWKLKDVKAAFNALADAFPWTEWTDAEVKPEWAEAAYKLVKAQEKPVASHFSGLSFGGDNDY